MASIVDNTFSRTEATFYYAGRNRLVRRDMFNGTKTFIEYEDSGCGCGGFTGLVESVRHEGSFGQVLFQEERRYDVNANVTAQRWNHLGEVGNVYRYDATYRMTDEYEGVNLQGSALDTFANPANTPTAFNRHYTFDTRGNRTLVEQTDASSSTVFDIGYSPDATTNVYDLIGGEIFQYNIVEQMTYDPTRGIYMGYDYMGRLIAEDNNSNMASPEKRYRYDVHSRLRVEETNYNPNEMTMFSCYAPNDPCGSGSCGGEQPEMSPMEHKFADSNDNTMWAIDYIIGVVAFGNGSAYTNRWDQVVGLTMTGGNDGKNGILIENRTIGDAEPNTATSTVRHENMQRSLLGVSDEDGFRTQENLNSSYGVPYQKLILWDGSAVDHFDDVAFTENTLELELTPASGVAQPITEDMIGAIARIANPDASPYVLHGFVIDVDTGNNIFYIDDPTGNLYALLTATETAMLTVFDNHDTGINEEAVHTAGTWEEESIVYDEEAFTTFTSSSTFPAQAVGWTLQPNANKPIFFPIVDVSGSTITVAGNLESVAQAGDQYFILHPPGVDKTTGAVDTNPNTQTSRHLAFGYHYLTPMVGVDTGEGIAGRQPGNNLAGQYQVWNRNYLPDIGRWTTPDPAMAQWSNLHTYAGANPARLSDPSGLKEVEIQCGNWREKLSGKSSRITVDFDDCTEEEIQDISKSICKAARAIFKAWKRLYRHEKGITKSTTVQDKIHNWFGKGADTSGRVNDVEAVIDDVEDELWDALKHIRKGISIECNKRLKHPGATNVFEMCINPDHSDLKTNSKRDQEKLDHLILHELIHWGNWEIDDDAGYFINGRWTGDDTSTDAKLDSADAYARFIADLIYGK